MKTKIFSIAFSLAGLVAGAQITITQNDLPSIGTMVGFVSDTTPVNVSPGPAGANQAWDLSALLPEDSGGYNFIDPAVAAGGSFFPNSNLAIPDSANTGATFFRKSPTSFDLHGAYSDFGYGPMALKFNPVEPWLTFPSQYQTTFSGTAKYQIVIPYSNPPIDSVKIVSTTLYSSIIDGWGTITTPDFSGVNVLRQKFTEIIIDSTFAHYFGIWAAVGTPTVDTTISYRWWSNNAKLYLAEIVTNPAGVVSKGTYMVDLSSFCTLVASATGTDETGPGNNDGTATATAGGGITPYFYNWSNGEDTSSVTNLSPGTYYVTISDAINCTVVDTIVIDGFVCTLAVSATAANESSFNANNGSATAAISGGTTPFTYVWSNGGNSSSITGLAPGIYSVSVTDNSGCSASDSAVVEAYVCSFSVAAYASDESSFNGNNGAATVAVTGGTSPYSYSWSNNGTTATITGLSPGSYSVIVTDTGNCVAEDSVTVNAYVCSLSLSLSSTNETTAGANNGTVNATPAGGTTPYNYLWNNSATTASVTGLSPGVYSVTVTDTANCTATGSVIVNGGGCTFMLDSVISVDVACNGDSTGSVSAYLSGGITPYAYSWSNGGSLFQISNLQSQIYSVTVSDAGNCFADTSVFIAEPSALGLSMSSTAALCNGGLTGTATATPSGGLSPYTYLWCTCAGSQVTPTATGLQAGNYYITITDANGCQENSTVAVSQPQALALFVSSVNASCNGSCDGSAIASVIGGITPYSYFWSNGDGQANSDSLCAGSYSITVSDFNGCLQTSTFSVNQSSPLQVTLSNPSSVVCEGDSVWVSGTPTGGATPYSYLWSNGSTDSITWVSSSQQFTLTVTDFYGCFTTASGSHPFYSTPVLSFGQTNILCNGSCDGTTTPSVTGGTSPFSFAWDNPCLSCPLFNDICPGTYTYTVVDSNGCLSTATVTLSQPAAIGLSLSYGNASCFNECDGYASASVSGGTSPYSYLWSPPPGTGQGTESAGQLCAGNDTLLITDSNNCTLETAFSVTQPTALSISLTATADSGNSGGTATVIASGGTAPYTFLWAGGQTTTTITGLSSGTYFLTATDDNGCTYTDSVEVPLFVGTAAMPDITAHLSVYPNPVKEELKLLLSFASEEKVEIVLIGSLGQETELFNRAVIKGREEISISTGNLSSGVYFLRISVPGKKTGYKRFVKM